MGVFIIFEGVTLNKGSELLYDTAETVGQRRSAPKSYIRALENLIFGIVFGDTIGTGTVANVVEGVPSPFYDLRDELRLNVDEVDLKGQGRRDEDLLLQDLQEREVLRKLILKLDVASLRQPAWSEHARREITDAKNDPALRIDLDDPSEYIFQRRYNFWPHRELQELVPPPYLDRMVAAVSDITKTLSDIREKALRAFLSRNVLAHILIFRGYQIGFAKRYSTNPATLHMPYPTRASLLELDDKHRVGQMAVRDYIVPRVLIPLLDKAHDRTDFRAVLHDYASGHTFDKPRNLLAEALTYEAEDQPLKVQQVIDSLTRWSGNNPSDTYCVGRVAGPYSKSLPIAVGQGLVSPDYYYLINKVFPEIGLGLNDEGAARRHFSQPEEQSGIRPSGKAIDLPALVAKLDAIPLGPTGAGLYHDFIIDALETIFFPQLQKPVKEQETSKGRKRIDIVFKNDAEDGFFADLRTKHGVHCPYIFFECKNYSKDLKNPEFDQLIGRLGNKRGLFGILVCRANRDRELIDKRRADAMNDNHRYILVFDDADIKTMLQFRAEGRYQAVNDYLDEKFWKLMFS